MARSLRSLRRFYLPGWALSDEADGALTYALSALIDVSVQRLRSGLEARFPSRAGASAQALIGTDRFIARGRDETNEHYAARLRAWRYPRGHRVRGNVFALLEQISEYFGGLALWGIDRSGNRRVRALDGAESYSYAYAWTWDTGAASDWARQWIVIDGSAAFDAQPDLDDPLLWGGALGNTDYCIGIGASSYYDWRAIIALTRGQHRWLPAGTQGEWIIVSLDGSTPAPDATWVKWGKLDGTDYVAARSSACRYVAIRDVLREYAGDADWANSVTTFDTWTGDSTDFPALITMPDGSYYAGTAAFPATITLPDDGSFPL
jgi:hypothetical protein